MQKTLNSKNNNTAPAFPNENVAEKPGDSLQANAEKKWKAIRCYVYTRLKPPFSIM